MYCLTSKPEKTVAALKKFVENFQYLEDQPLKQSNQLFFKNTEAQSRSNEVLVLEKQVGDFTEKLNLSEAQNVIAYALSGGGLTALAMHRTAFELRISNYVSNCEKLTSGGVSLDDAFRKYRTYVESKISRLQTTVMNETRRANGKRGNVRDCFCPRGV